MAFYYVKSGGTATGDAGRATTLRTGSFGATSTYYDSLNDLESVPTTAWTSSDTVICSHLHNKDYAAAQTIVFPDNVNPTLVVSVDDTAQDSYLAGAKDGIFSGTASLIIDNMFHSIGVTTGAASNWQPGSINCQFIIEDGGIELLTAGDRILVSGDDGASMRLVNSVIKYTQTDNHILWQTGGRFEWFGGSVTGSAAIADLFKSGFGGGGGLVKLVGVDLVNVTGFILGEIGNSQSVDDTIEFIMHGCKISASLTRFVEEDFSNGNHYFRATNCAATSAAAEHQFFQRTWGGDVEDQDDSGIHRDESTAYPGGEKVSMKVVTVAACTPQRDLVFDLATHALLSSSDTDTIRIFFTSTTTLNDQNVWAELIYPDGTNQHLYTYLNNRNADILATAVTHTDDSGSSTWKDGGSDLAVGNEYRMDLDTSGDVGADSVPVIRIHVGVASATIYFDTTVGVVA